MKTMDVRVKPEQMAALAWIYFLFILYSDSILAEDILDMWWYKGLVRAAFAIVCVFWMLADAKRRGVDKTDAYVAFCAVVPEFTLPVYVIRTRGWFGAARWLAYVFLMLFSIALVSIIAMKMHGAML